jgi:multiple sugar transport system permease protein
MSAAGNITSHRDEASGWRFVRFALALLFALPAAFFVFWMLSLSLKTEVENINYPPIFLPRTWNFQNYVDVFAKNNMLRYLINSLLVTGAATVIGLILALPAAYAIARMKLNVAASLVLLARMTPALSYLIPLFFISKYLGISGTIWPVILSHLLITVPLITWTMIGHFQAVPEEIEEAAIIDGCNFPQLFFFIILPLVRSGIVIAVVIAAMFSWNNFIFSVILSSQQWRTLPVAIFGVMSFEQLSWGPLAAAAFIVTAPMLLLAGILMRFMVAGLTAGATKG